MKRGKFSQLLLLLLMVPGSGITFANPNGTSYFSDLSASQQAGQLQ